MRTKPRRQAEANGGRERLLAAAGKLFAAKGYAATSVREILKAAKVTAPVLYYHFGNKEGLFIGLLRQGLEALYAEEEKALAGAKTPADKVRAFCRARVGFDQRHPDVRWVAEEILAGPRPVAPRFDIQEPVAKRIQLLANLVDAAVDNGEFRPCNSTAAAFVLLGAIQMTGRFPRFRRYFPPPEASPEQILETALDGLRTAPQPPGAPKTKPKKRKRLS